MKGEWSSVRGGKKGWPGMQAPLAAAATTDEARGEAKGERKKNSKGRRRSGWNRSKAERRGENGRGARSKEKGDGEWESENQRSVTIACRLERQTVQSLTWSCTVCFERCVK